MRNWEITLGIKPSLTRFQGFIKVLIYNVLWGCLVFDII